MKTKFNVLITTSTSESAKALRNLLPSYKVKSEQRNQQVCDTVTVYILSELSKLIVDSDYRIVNSIIANIPFEHFYKTFDTSVDLYKNLLYREILRVGVCIEKKTKEEISSSKEGEVIRKFIDNLVNDIKIIIA